MDQLFPAKVWNYKNFNMVTELDIAGEFIYDGIHVLNQMRTVDEEASLFSFLYHTAVGIERLQKIVIVLFEVVQPEQQEEFEKSLITHSHTGLHERIKKLTKIDFNARENRFLHMLTSFYNSARYDRFNLNSQFAREKQLFSDYLIEHIGPSKIKYDSFYGEVLLLTPQIKEILGRIIGAISKKYYDLVREGCKKAGTYTYELRTDSKAEKIFRSTYKKNSLQEQKVTEKIALKELLVCLRRSKEKSPLLHYIESMEPLEFDLALFNEYIGEIAAGTIPQSLVDEVETLYEENHYYQKRREAVDAIGNPNIDFDFYPVHQCVNLIETFVKDSDNPLEFAKTFREIYEMIDDECNSDNLEKSSKLCEAFLDTKVALSEFISEIELLSIKLKEEYHFNENN